MTGRSGRRPSAGALLTVAVYAFLYAPLIVLVAFSFNRARLAARWEGFTLDWYAVALRGHRAGHDGPGHRGGDGRRPRLPSPARARARGLGCAGGGAARPPRDRAG